MFYFYLCLLLIPVTANVSASTEIFNVESASDGIFYFFTHFSSVVSGIKEIFNIVLSDNPGKDSNSTTPIPEDAYLNIKDLTAKYERPFEEHNVTTEDKYILTLHRIPCKENCTSEVIFLMHGLVDSSDTWILQGPNKSLGYILADKGYDIWMGNARGNKYSLSHEYLKPRESKFWQFTWEEIGIYDLTAMIDYILNVTNNSQLYYIGHSQGTTSFYVMNSMRPEYNKKIKMMFSLAPVAWCKNVKSPIVRMFSPAYKILGYFLSNFNTYSPTTEFFNKFVLSICTVLRNKCDNLMKLIVGNDHKFINKTMLPIVLGHIPSSSSTMQFMHYGQLVESGRFRRYDYGEKRNMERYNDTKPPDYDLRRITIPVSLFYSGNDWLSDRADVEVLIEKLPNVKFINYIESFNHWDYLYAEIASDVIYSNIIKQITVNNFNITGKRIN